MSKAVDASTEALQPVLASKGLHPHINLDAMMLDYAGVCYSFMLHAKKAAARFNVDVSSWDEKSCWRAGGLDY